MKEYVEDPLTKIYREKAGSRSRFEEAKKRFAENPLALDEFLAECFLSSRCPHCGTEVSELDAVHADGFFNDSHRRAFYRETASREPSLSSATALSFAKWKIAKDVASRAIEQAATPTESDSEEEPLKEAA
jgi:hypothetical protein